MRVLVVCLLLLICQWVHANSYVVMVQFGEKTTQFNLDFQKDQGELSQSDHPTKKVHLNPEDSKLLLEQVLAVQSAKSDQIQFCTRSFIALHDQMKNETRISCIGSTTGISKKATTLANSLTAAYRFL